MWKEKRSRWATQYFKTVWSGRYQYELVITQQKNEALKGFISNPITKTHSPNILSDNQEDNNCFFSLGLAQQYLESKFRAMKRNGEYLLVKSEVLL